MTEPTGGTPHEPPAAAPEPAPLPPEAVAPAAPAAPPASAWETPPPPITAPPAPAALQGAKVEAGPAPGVEYAGLGVRIGAWIIDGLIYGVAFYILLAIVVGIFGAIGGVGAALIAVVIMGILSLFGSMAYFVYFWTTARASLGQRVLGLETVNAADGATLTRDQAIKRWIWLQGVFVIATVLNGVIGNNFLSLLISLASFGYLIYLVYTTNSSPKRQGYHDVQAGTVVVTRKKA